jgi:hypothetical protein
VTLLAPNRDAGRVLPLLTQVPDRAHTQHLFPTFTLLRGVALAGPSVA